MIVYSLIHSIACSLVHCKSTATCMSTLHKKHHHFKNVSQTGSTLSLTLGAHARSEGYCSCPVCMYVCVCVRSNLPPHTLESQMRDTNGSIAIQELFKFFSIWLKMLIQKLWYNLIISSSSGILALFFSTK